SDDDFLARTGGKSDVESDDDFLKRTGAAPGETKEAATVAAPPTPNGISGEGRDEYGRPLGPLAPPAPAEAVPSWNDLRNALQPEPGYVRAAPLPFALKETYPGSGEADPKSGWAGLKFDPLSTVATVANPLLSLLECTRLA